MALSYKSRRRVALLVLVFGLPIYIALCAVLVGLFEQRPSVLVELGIYVGMGLIWAFPMKSIFMGIGQADPDAPKDDAQN